MFYIEIMVSRILRILIIYEISMGIRGNNMGWIKGGGLCEVCGLRPAEVNLDLQYGSHRECRIY